MCVVLVEVVVLLSKFVKVILCLMMCLMCVDHDRMCHVA